MGEPTKVRPGIVTEVLAENVERDTCFCGDERTGHMGWPECAIEEARRRERADHSDEGDEGE